VQPPVALPAAPPVQPEKSWRGVLNVFARDRPASAKTITDLVRGLIDRLT
jgi:hypothetical protein